MKQKKKIEFSKKIFYIVTTITIVVVLYSMALMWYTKDPSALAYLIPSVFTLMSAGTGFYYWKAKAENKIKLEKKYGIKINEDTEENVDEENV